MPSPMKVGTTVMMNSSIASSSRKDPMISPPPVIQTFLPACVRRRSAKAPIDSVHGSRTEARAHLQTPVKGLTAEDLGIGGALEFRETVEALWSRPFRQPIEIAIWSSHVAVRARRNIHDDFSLWHARKSSRPRCKSGYLKQEMV
jgi:hypothetical protein